MEREVYFVKSLEEDFATKTLKGKNKVIFQTVQDMVKTKIIKPNTKSFGRKRRLSCTTLDKKYTKTYRPQGIIFKTNQTPDYIMPLDLVLLSAADKIIVHYYRIKNNLHVYYNHTLIPGFEKFIFKDFHSMVEKYPSPKIVWKEVNKFRRRSGFGDLPKQKFRLVEYNEAVFHRTVKIQPVALFGYKPQTIVIAKKLGLPHYVSAKEFYNRLKKTEEDKTLLLIGRFQPIHNGHLSLIRRYHNAGFFIKIAVGSSDKCDEKNNPLNANEREEMIRRAMKEYKIDKYKIFMVQDISNDSNYVEHVRKIAGKFDTMVTGNPKVLKLFLNCKSNGFWNIESFEESSGRPGGNVNSSLIRRSWLKGGDKRYLPKSVFEYLKSIGFSERLKKINERKQIIKTKFYGAG